MEAVTPKKSENLICQVLFALCVGVTYLNIYELTFAVWSITFLFTVKRRYSFTVLGYISCFVAIFLIALIVSFFNQFKGYLFFRDVSYLLKPILGLLVGYQLCRNTKIKPFHTIIYVGLGIAVIHLGMIFYNAVVHRIINIHELRHYTGYFSDFEFYALIVLFFNKEFEVELSPKRKWTFFLIVAISGILYVSRTNFIQFIILFLAMKGYFKLTKRAVIVMTTIIIVTLSGYAILYNMPLTRNGPGIEAFLYKIKNAPIEAFKSKVNQNDWQDFNDNYRSYETIITIRQVSSEGTSGVLFGKGMGSTIDLGRQLWTNDGEFIRYLPTLHNGYTTVFLKTGLTGILFSIIFLVLLGRQGKSDIPLVQQINLFLKGSAVFLVLANWVLLGLYLKIDNKALIIGFILAYKELIVKRSRLNPDGES
ncbi:MAG: hypothetical protein EOO48_06410 [Flavobacterium sp.]|nr:MAG: hypothetical protein EOO48_06410 [Flavobacterium sp.]